LTGSFDICNDKQTNFTHTRMHAHTHTHTHTHTQPFYSSMDFVRNNPGEPVPEETFTHCSAFQ